jgi:hypothetical protein
MVSLELTGFSWNNGFTWKIGFSWNSSFTWFSAEIMVSPERLSIDYCQSNDEGKITNAYASRPELWIDKGTESTLKTNNSRLPSFPW